MKLFISQTFLLLLVNILSVYFFFSQLIYSKKNYISIQLKYFIFKTVIYSSITYFFCFFSPSNRVKLILLSLVIFISFHFLEAIIIQNKINKEDN